MLSTILGYIAIGVIASNWYSAVRGVMLKKKAPSWVPLVGGICGAASLLIEPREMLSWWLPLILDWGCLPGLVHWAWWSRREGDTPREKPAGD